MAGQATYENINAAVRPPRCAILISRNTKYWKTAVNGAIARASEVWGGRHFLLIPTDGVTIEDKFWELLSAYSPDHLAIFNLTFADLEAASPAEYQATEQEYRKGWVGAGHPTEDFDEWFEGSASSSLLDELTVSDELKEQLLQQLSPFHHSFEVTRLVTGAMGFGYPFTKVSDIISTTTRHIGAVTLPKLVADPTLALLLHSQTGIASEEYCKELNDEHFVTQGLPEAYENLEFLEHVFGRPIRKAGVGVSGWRPEAEYMGSVPFGLSMLHLMQYYRGDLHQPHKEPAVVVLGDTIDDFCLYYSLSRLHEKVFWLPLAWLRSCYSALGKIRRLLAAGEEAPRRSVEHHAVRMILDIAYESIGYGHDERRIELRSMSLSKRQLIAFRRQMADCAVTETDRFASMIDCVLPETPSTRCIGRVFEENNHTNYRSMIFVDRKSVSPVETPKPKNFSEIRVPKHYWITELQIDGYQPPSLSNLGPKLVNIHGSTTESRVTADGIAYQCPSAMYFGGDVDVITVRPKIEMPDAMELFGAYFESIGASVRYSDKGKYFVDTVRRFGSLDAVGRFIKAPTTRNILDKFMQSKDADSGVYFLKSDQRAYLTLEAITASMGDKEGAADLVDSLMGCEVLRRGYILRCARCSSSSWYGLEVLTSEFTCSRCSLRQQIIRGSWKNGLLEPEWSYKLAETVYQFYYHHSDLTALVLYKLKSQSTVAFHYAPEIELVDFPAAGQSKEMDVACIVDGQIVFGECKTEPLKIKELAKFKDLIWKPIKNPAKIIFATTEPVSTQFENAIGGLPNGEIWTRSGLYDD